MIDQPITLEQLAGDPAKATALSLEDAFRLLGQLGAAMAAVTARAIALQTAAPAGNTLTAGTAGVEALTPDQLATRWNVDAAYIQQLCRARKLPAFKSGKYWLIPVAALQAWVAEHRVDQQQALASASAAAAAPPTTAAAGRPGARRGGARRPPGPVPTSLDAARAGRSSPP